MTDFATALNQFWPTGDKKIPGLRAGMAKSAPAVFTKYGIDSPLVLAHLMAQLSMETAGGREVVENMNYTASRLTVVWPGRFPNMVMAAPYACNPKALANSVYGGRMGNIGVDDGWRFIGRGAAQTTGREGYVRLAKSTGLDLVNNPDLVNDPAHFLECGVADFINCGCLPYAKADDCRGVTKHLNGGFIGLAERKVWLARWKAAEVPVPT